VCGLGGGGVIIVGITHFIDCVYWEQRFEQCICLAVMPLLNSFT
jgi:hypothetical protein